MNKPMPIPFRRAIEHEHPSCYVCGRKISETEEPKMIVVVNGGSHWVPSDDDADMDDPGFMGGHPVGPECYRRLTAAREAAGVGS